MPEVKYPAHVLGLVQSLMEEGSRKDTWLILADAMEEMELPGSAFHCRGHAREAIWEGAWEGWPWNNCLLIEAINKNEAFSEDAVPEVVREKEDVPA